MKTPQRNHIPDRGISDLDFLEKLLYPIGCWIPGSNGERYLMIVNIFKDGYDFWIRICGIIVFVNDPIRPAVVFKGGDDFFAAIKGP